MLKERTSTVLRLLVHEYVVSAIPVASEAIARQAPIKVSAATVRSEMVELEEFAQTWFEVQPSQALKSLAHRLLRVRPLRAADSLQLAAAIVTAEGDPATLDFVGFDERLNRAASREGFKVVTH